MSRCCETDPAPLDAAIQSAGCNGADWSPLQSRPVPFRPRLINGRLSGLGTSRVSIGLIARENRRVGE